MTKRIGLFGGTFDPIHNGHLRLAESALQECSLDTVLFLPAAYPPHKPALRLTSFSHRAEMIRLALHGRKMYEYSLIEAELPSPSYTVATIRYLNRHFAEEKEFFFLTGIDAFLEIQTWKDFEEILHSVSFIVSEREGDFEGLKDNLACALGYFREGRRWKNAEGRKTVFFLDRPPLAISSSDIRREVRARHSVCGLVPDAVETYILAHELYSDRESSGRH